MEDKGIHVKNDVLEGKIQWKSSAIILFGDCGNFI